MQKTQGAGPPCGHEARWPSLGSAPSLGERSLITTPQALDGSEAERRLARLGGLFWDWTIDEPQARDRRKSAASPPPLRPAIATTALSTTPLPVQEEECDSPLGVALAATRPAVDKPKPLELPFGFGADGPEGEGHQQLLLFQQQQLLLTSVAGVDEAWGTEKAGQIAQMLQQQKEGQLVGSALCPALRTAHPHRPPWSI